MKDKKNRNIIIGIGITISFALLMFSITLYYNYLHEQKQSSKLTTEQINNMTLEEIKEHLNNRQPEKLLIRSYYLIPFTAFIGLLVGTIIYYIMSDKIIEKENDIILKERSIKNKEKELENNAKVILNFLTPMERKVIETLLEGEGRVQQYELSHLPGLNKLKTHRIISNLEQKGIIHKEKLGKINKIVLNKELYKVLK